MPLGARKLAVYSNIHSSGNANENLYPVPATTALWDMPNVYAENPVINDQAARNDEISGTLTWKNPLSGYLGESYEIYFAASSSYLGSPLGKVAAAQTNSSFSIPEHTLIPRDALAFAIVMKSPDGDLCPWPTWVPIDKKMSKKPLIKN